MNKKIICILFCAVLMTTLLPLTSASNIKMNTELKQNWIPDGYILDQSQLIWSYREEQVIEKYLCAQSFKPSVTPLVKIDLFCRVHTTTAPLKIAIRVELDGEDLTFIELPADHFSTTLQWTEIDFPDVEVTPEQTYYIVASCDGPPSNFYGYYFGVGANVAQDYYERGYSWYSLDGGLEWRDREDESYSDLCFRTYTYGEVNNNPPNIPNIDGPTSGKPEENYYYTFSTIDPDGDDVFYLIDWGFGVLNTYGPYESGEADTKKRFWREEGTYEIKIKAQDINGAESDWATLEVTMPRYRLLMCNFLEHFPFIKNLVGL